MKKNFDITAFTDYRKVASQYTDTYIKNSRSVVIKENEDEVFVVCSKSVYEKIEKKIEQFHYPKKVNLSVVSDSDFEQFVGNIVEGNTVKKADKKDISRTGFVIEEVSETSPAVNIINATCLNAIKMGASDIHIVPENHKTCIRFRIDGVLQNIKEFDYSMFNSLSSRIKVMSNLNIMETRLCQDGHMKLKTDGKEIDFRVSIVPVIGGESIVLRLFNSDIQKADLDELGFSKPDVKFLKEAVALRSGLILISGPTGSGKTTTIHSLINQMDKKALKIITIEDPVERIIDDIEQIEVNEAINLTFESVLRCVLRQDPDVIMIGEIRDRETAELAVRASLTGHVIISTLHTDDSISTITRLTDLGVEPYLIASVFKYSVAQRLVRKTCPLCGGIGCEKCGFTGYKGRTVISEMFKIDEALSQMISERKSAQEIKKYLLKNGMKFLKDDAAAKVRLKKTTREEIKREALA